MSYAALPRPPLPASTESGLPASPCVRNCCLDDGNVCLGCGRHLDEILGWHQADADGRRAILAQAALRQDARRQRLAG